MTHSRKSAPYLYMIISFCVLTYRPGNDSDCVQAQIRLVAYTEKSWHGNLTATVCINVPLASDKSDLFK